MSDLISRADAISVLDNFTQTDTLGHTPRQIVEALPSAQPERMRGRWIEIQAPDSDGNGLYECSICHRGEVHVPIVEVPFCWHCGAYMREEQDETD